MLLIALAAVALCWVTLLALPLLDLAERFNVGPFEIRPRRQPCNGVLADDAGGFCFDLNSRFRLRISSRFF